MSFVCPREVYYLPDSPPTHESTRYTLFGSIHVVIICSNRTVSSKRSTVRSFKWCRSPILTLHKLSNIGSCSTLLPGALQDAAVVYAHLATHHLGARKGPDGKYRFPDLPTPNHEHAHDAPTTQDPVVSTSTSSMGQFLDYDTSQELCNSPRHRGFSFRRRMTSTACRDDSKGRRSM